MFQIGDFEHRKTGGNEILQIINTDFDLKRHDSEPQKMRSFIYLILVPGCGQGGKNISLTLLLIHLLYIHLEIWNKR